MAKLQIRVDGADCLRLERAADNYAAHLEPGYESARYLALAAWLRARRMAYWPNGIDPDSPPGRSESQESARTEGSAAHR
jgi:hypothetical protein